MAARSVNLMFSERYTGDDSRAWRLEIHHTARCLRPRGRPRSPENRVSFWRHPIDFISVTSSVCTDQRQDSRSPIPRVLRAVHRSGAPPTRRYWGGGPRIEPLIEPSMIHIRTLRYRRERLERDGIRESQISRKRRAPPPRLLIDLSRREWANKITM